jgi:hypothetical protein
MIGIAKLLLGAAAAAGWNTASVESVLQPPTERRPMPDRPQERPGNRPQERPGDRPPDRPSSRPADRAGRPDDAPPERRGAPDRRPDGPPERSGGPARGRGEPGPNPAVEAWIKTLAEKIADPHDTIRNSARAALVTMGPRAAPILKGMAEEGETARAVAAKNVLEEIHRNHPAPPMPRGAMNFGRMGMSRIVEGMFGGSGGGVMPRPAEWGPPKVADGPGNRPQLPAPSGDPRKRD